MALKTLKQLQNESGIDRSVLLRAVYAKQLPASLYGNNYMVDEDSAAFQDAWQSWLTEHFQQSRVKPIVNGLAEMAELAVRYHIVNRKAEPSSRRAIVTPIQTLLYQIEHTLSDLHALNPGTPRQQQEIMIARATAKGELEQHVGHTHGVDQYVDLFFDTVLGEACKGNPGTLLQREKLLEAAYMTFFRQAQEEAESESTKSSGRREVP